MTDGIDGGGRVPDTVPDPSGLSGSELGVLKELAKHAELLTDHAQRQKNRRKAGPSFKSDVSKNPGWTERDAKLNGLNNALASVRLTLAKRLKLLDDLTLRVKEAEEDVLVVTRLIEEFHASEEK